MMGTVLNAKLEFNGMVINISSSVVLLFMIARAVRGHVHAPLEFVVSASAAEKRVH